MKKLLYFLAVLVLSLNLKAQTMVDTVSYCTNFENLTDQGFWIFKNSQINKWCIDTATNNGGAYSLYISNDNGLNNAMSDSLTYSYAMRKIHFTAGLYEVSYDWKANGYYSLSYQYLRVFLIPTTATFTGGSLYQGLSATTLPTGAISLDGNSALWGQTSWATFQNPIVSVPATDDYYLVFFWYNNSSTVSGVSYQPPAAIDNICINTVSCPQPMDLQITDHGNTSVELTWQTYGQMPLGWIVEYGQQGFTPGTGTSFFVTTNSVILTGLVSQVPYQVYVKAICSVGDTSSAGVLNYFYCNNPIGCVDYTNLTGALTMCTYGTYQTYGTYTQAYPGPYANVGIIDFGPYSYGSGNTSGSQHTVHTDLYDRDVVTNNQLTTVPPQECMSVRLGGRGGTNLCQSIKYTIPVDSNLFDALVIRYAPVLTKGTQANHSRFTIELLDASDSLIAPIFDVNPYNTAGWRQGTDSNILWKPWDMASVDFRSLPQETYLKLRFTTYHCGNDTAYHFGYAYYSLRECVNAQLLPAQSFLNKERAVAFKAPNGFRYQWFLYSDTTDIIDTTQIATIPYAEHFGCRITDMFGHTRVLSGLAYDRSPHSVFTATINMPTCTKRVVELHANPFVTIDDINDTAKQEVDFYHWIVDGNIKPDASLDADFELTPGTHNIKFVSGLGYNGKIDTMAMTIIVPDTGFLVKNIFDTILIGETYTFGDRTLTHSGNYTDTLTSAQGCDSIVSLYLVVKGESLFQAEQLPEINVYPNPVRNMLTIETSAVVEKLELIDNLGRTQLVLSNAQQLNLSGLENGIYHIRITTPQGIVVKRIVKQ